MFKRPFGAWCPEVCSFVGEGRFIESRIVASGSSSAVQVLGPRRRSWEGGTINVRPHMTPDRHSDGLQIVLAIQKCWAENASLSRSLPDLNQRIEANIAAVLRQHDLSLGEWHLWCKATPR